MLRKILVFILCLSLIMPTTTSEVKAAEYETKYLTIERLNDGVTETYEVVTDGENVYIGVGDLIEIVGFDEKIIDMTDDTVNQIILTKEISHHGFDQDINIFPKEKKIKSAWYGEDEFDGCLNLEEGVYLDIIQIFNYLRVKAEVEGDELWINIPVYSILDFMIYDYKAVLMNSVSQLDLLEAQENRFASGFFDALCLACNNFDFKLLIPGWGSNELKNEQYTKAIQTLNEDNEIFYNENTSEYIKSELATRGFEGILASGEDLVNVMSISGATVETAEDIIEVLENVSNREEINDFMNLVNWNGGNFDGITEMRAWNKHAENMSNVIDLADIAVSAYETYTRAKNWNQECLDDLDVLRNLDVNNYVGHTEYVERIKKVAEKCYQESSNTEEAVAEQTLIDMSTLLLEKVIAESSVYGKVADYFVLAVNTGISVARCFGNVAEEMDKGELSYMVSCLINIAVASRIDAEIEYDMLNLANIYSGEVEEFRDSIRTAIKSNLRCWSYIYYLKSDGEWENTYRGKEVKNKIDKMNTYLTLLNESAQYDYALDEYALITYSPRKIIDILKDSNKAISVNFEHSFIESNTGDGEEYANILGVDESGSVVWDYQTGKYGTAQLDRIFEIGVRKDKYYFVEDGTIVVLNISDGSVLWKNEDYGGFGTAFAFGDDETLYLCGYLRPDFFAVDKDGNTLCRIETFDSQYYWPMKIEYLGDRVEVTFEASPLGYGYDNKCVVDLKDYTYSFWENYTTTNNEDDDIAFYRDVLNMFYYKIAGGWNKTEDVSYLFYEGYTSIQTWADAGYALIDLDKNGVSELLVTSVADAADGMIYDLYTYVDEEVVHLATSGERYRYYLCDDYTIYFEGSGGAENSFYEIYTIDQNKASLSLKEIVVYDDYKDENNPWFYGNQVEYDEMGGYNTENMTHITEVDARNIINGYKTTSIQLNSFEQYSP